jgi:hypothetical protein
MASSPTSHPSHIGGVAAHAGYTVGVAIQGHDSTSVLTLVRCRRVLGSSHQASVDDIMFMVERDIPLSAKSGRKEE